MKISKEVINLIKCFEGFRAAAYQCPAGVWTIGYGTTNGVKQGDLITEDRAEKFLLHDLVDVEQTINRVVIVPLAQHQYDALCSLVYNIGVGAFKKSALLKKLNAGKYSEVPAQIMRWNKAKGKVLAGLVARRQSEANLFSGSKEVKQTMPQAVDSPDKPIVQSRTIVNASTAGIVGTVLAVVPAIEPAGKVVEIVQNNTQGFLIVLGIVLVAFAAVAIYIKISERRSA